MADLKITQLPANTAPLVTDILPMVADPGGTPATDKVTISSLMQTILADAWTPVSDTWVYASATSFTISGVDRTTIFTPGTKLKFTNNSVTVYATVASSSFSTNTTVNLMANSDFSINNSSITAPYYSYGEPQGFPNGFNMSMANITGLTSTAGSILKFATHGRQLFLYFDFNGTSTAATMTLPVPVIASPTATQHVQSCAVVDNGSWSNPGNVGFKSSESAATIYWGKSSTSFVANAYGGFTSSGTKGAIGVFTYPF